MQSETGQIRARYVAKNAARKVPRPRATNVVTRRALTASLALVAAVAFAATTSTTAQAGGLARPNPISARNVGLSGAFGAVVDDPTALYFNPAGLAAISSASLVLGAEFAYAPRYYRPFDQNGDLSDPQSPNAPLFVLPVVGFAARIPGSDGPSRATAGIGVWVPFGGSLEYEPLLDANDNPLPAVNRSLQTVIEIVPGVAYEVNDVVAVGAALRIGVGLFAIDTTQKPLDANLSAQGIGLGATVGVMVKPTQNLRFGAVFRTSMDVTTNGDGTTADAGGNVNTVEVTHVQPWPASAGISAAFDISPQLLVAAQFDWMGWNRFDTLIVDLGIPGYVQELELDWSDTYAVHGGARYAVHPAITASGGISFETGAVNPRTRERQYSDSDKIMLNGGVSAKLTASLYLDVAGELMFNQPTIIEDNSADFANWPSRANAAPGEHHGRLYTVESALRFVW